MVETKTAWKRIIAKALAAQAEAKATATGTAEATMPEADAIVLERPPKPELGDFGFPMFPYAKLLRSAPAQLAQALAAIVALDSEASSLGTARAEGPYLNVRLSRDSLISEVLQAAASPGWGRFSLLAGKKVMVEFSSPNTNKPLHLGHLRNDVLGESLARILAAAGAEVRKINHPNDRGVHICKSMLAYQAYGEGRTPVDEGLKGDHFVGKYYVLFNKLKEEDPEAESKAQDLLVKWEAGDPEVRALWQRMKEWVIEGIKVTYARTGISFDLYDFESDTYSLGVENVVAGLESGVFYREEDGSVWADFEDVGLDKKVFLRKDGTSLYITQDIGTAILRHQAWPYDRLIYVVGSEQQYHFKILFETLRRLGYDWASDLHHLAYGMVNLPSGRMKTREGTVVDADDLIDELAALAAREIEAKGREDAVGDTLAVAEKIALGALHYYLLQTGPLKGHDVRSGAIAFLFGRYRALHPIHGGEGILHHPQARGGGGQRGEGQSLAGAPLLRRGLGAGQASRRLARSRRGGSYGYGAVDCGRLPPRAGRRLFGLVPGQSGTRQPRCRPRGEPPRAGSGGQAQFRDCRGPAVRALPGSDVTLRGTSLTQGNAPGGPAPLIDIVSSCGV